MVHFTDTSFMKGKKNLNGNHSKEQRKLGFMATKFVEFCKRTDLHGYKYVVMEDLNMFERCCWAVAVLMSNVFAAYFVVTAYKWYSRNPIVTVIESTQGAIWDVPFPAVTICNLNIISRKAAQQFADSVTLPVNVTAENVFKALKFVPLLHSTFVVDGHQKELLLMLQTVLELNSISMENLFTTLSPASNCNNLVQRCMWKNTIYRCDTLFQQVFSFFAVCCTFNYFAIETKAKGSSVSHDQKEMPRRVASCGYQTALTVLVNTRTDDYYSAGVASQGALVLIDNAYNIADLDSPLRLVNPATEVLIALTPERTYATPGVRSFKPQDRQCYYNDEVNIGYFRQYSFHNCMSYQRAEIIKNICDCVPFYFPFKDYHRTCNFNDLECLQSFLDPKQNRSHLLHDPQLPCLPECEHYEYLLEVALGKLAEEARLNRIPFFSDISLENHSLVNVFFNDLVSTRYRRDVYLNWQNLLASFGGLLSLMLGFTLISGFDLLLFFTFGMIYGSCTKNFVLPEDQQKIITHKVNKIHVKKVDTSNQNFMKKKLSDTDQKQCETAHK